MTLMAILDIWQLWAVALPSLPEIPAKIQSSQTLPDQNIWTVEKQKLHGTERSEMSMGVSEAAG